MYELFLLSLSLFPLLSIRLRSEWRVKYGIEWRWWLFVCGVKETKIRKWNDWAELNQHKITLDVYTKGTSSWQKKYNKVTQRNETRVHCTHTLFTVSFFLLKPYSFSFTSQRSALTLTAAYFSFFYIFCNVFVSSKLLYFLRFLFVSSHIVVNIVLTNAALGKRIQNISL